MHSNFASECAFLIEIQGRLHSLIENMRPFENSQGGLFKTALENPLILTGGFWEELRVFLAVAKTGSFAKAGKLLGVSVPTVSRSVRRLQDQFRVQLVSISRTGVVLTPDGKELGGLLADLDLRLFQIASNFRQRTRDVVGTVRLAVTEGLAGVFVASHLTGLQKRYPGVSVHLRTPINVGDLRQNQADLMIGFSTEMSPEITVVPLGYLHLIPVVSETYVEQHGLPERDHLDQHLFVDSQFYMAKTGLWHEWHNVVSKGRVVAECDSSLAYGMTVVSGLGIGLLGNYVLSDPKMRHLDLGVHVRVPMYLLGLAERFHSRPVRVVAELLESVLGPQNPWFSPELATVTPNHLQFVETVDALQGAAPRPADV